MDCLAWLILLLDVVGDVGDLTPRDVAVGEDGSVALVKEIVVSKCSEEDWTVLY